MKHKFISLWNFICFSTVRNIITILRWSIHDLRVYKNVVVCLYRQGLILKCHTVIQVLHLGACVIDWPNSIRRGRLCGSSSFITHKPWFLFSDFPGLVPLLWFFHEVICAMLGFFLSWLLSSRSCLWGDVFQNLVADRFLFCSH